MESRETNLATFSSTPVASPLLASGTRLGDFEIDALIARGGFGAIYRARQLRLARDVVVKVADLGARGNASVRREVDRLRRLRHPNIVHLYDLGETDDGLLWLAMELVEGETLTARLRRRGPMRARQAHAVLLQLLDALTEAHGRGIVHRDLKPDNIMLTRRGARRDVVKLLDFGIAELLESTTRTDPGLAPQAGTALLGTPRYMAPELLDAHIGPANDVYATGLIAIEILSGAPAIGGIGAAEILARHMQGTLDIPRWVAASPLGPVIDRAVARDPAERFASARPFYDALAALAPEALEALEGDGEPTSDVRPIVEAMALDARQPPAKPPEAPRERDLPGDDDDGLWIDPSELETPPAPQRRPREPSDSVAREAIAHLVTRPRRRRLAISAAALAVMVTVGLLALLDASKTRPSSASWGSADNSVFNEVRSAPAPTRQPGARQPPRERRVVLPSMPRLAAAASDGASHGLAPAHRLRGEVAWTLETTPTRARVMLDGEVLCERTPCTAYLERASATRTVTLERRRHRSASATLDLSHDGSLALRLVREPDTADQAQTRGFGLIKIP